MMMHVLDEVGQITDAELVSRLEGLVKDDRVLIAKLLVHLGEVDARRLFCERAYSSIFEYCRSGLGMSEGEAGLRILAARVGRKFPLVLERLGDGSVHLTGIKLLAPLLMQDNHVQLLDRVRGMTKRQIEVMVADLAPKPDAPARSHKVREPRGLFESGAAVASPLPCSTSVSPQSKASATTPEVNNSTVAQPSAADVGSRTQPSTFALQSPRARATSAPLGLGRFKLQVTLGQEAQNALEQLVELFRHQNPSGDLASIVERALIELRKVKMKQRFGQTDACRRRVNAKAVRAVEVKKKSEVPSPTSRHIPAAVRRVVHARDNGQCTYVSPDGRRCTERGFMEVHHHTTTFARGGEATADNLRLACRAHNQFLAEKDYGRAFMQQKLHEARTRSPRIVTIPETDQV